MSTSQRAVMPCGWGVKAGMARVCVWQVKLRDPLVTHDPYLRILAVVLPMIRRYTNHPLTAVMLLKEFSCHLFSLCANRALDAVNETR